MKLITTLILFLISFCSLSQNQLKKQIELIEQNIKSNSMSDFQKLETDLDNDNDLDYIYLYQCSEPKCIEVYLNVNQKLEKVISEFCYNYYLYNGVSKDLVVKQNHCCGESPFTSNRIFNFHLDKTIIKENYVIFNDSYELLEPNSYLSNAYNVKIINNNYNVRFSPNIRVYDEDESMFACETKTNVIGKLKKDSTTKVLSELIKGNRIWLFVEIDSEDLNDTQCTNPIDYGFKGQKLRGWISNNFVEKTNT
ncbi:hypothetical protein [Psychroserpens sp. NJDZ02]|uniref:hypothetical protein n=1 Tax=Psychroserpens sp. NJDZ02 TaxID=2570561 RepID=UPI0010A7531A|nr:hypothetical protein [Psychroserpens sp. NJDZ02]QCE42071.1 hypothetical protein E9099_11860 [Psychroserpens sp. NJDZ02]